LTGKGQLLAIFIAIEGLGLMLFAGATVLWVAITWMVVFALFLKMANGTTYALTPFINQKNMGTVAGIIGAGGNIGGMLMGFLFKNPNLGYGTAFFYIGCMAVVAALVIAVTKFGRVPESQSANKVKY
jgi:MFS transporter, NNP family, nitrate/nitrite transporter